MRTCRACGGVLGRDCFNEQDCLAISASIDYENGYKAQMYDEVKNDFNEALHHINNLVKLLMQYPVDGSISSEFVNAQMFHFKHTVHKVAEPVVIDHEKNMVADDDLPF